VIKHIFPASDSTIYERYPDKNTSVDEILELTKFTEGYPVESNLEDEFFPATYNSRILLSFDLSAISASVVSGKISSNNSCGHGSKSKHGSYPFKTSLTARG
jgi:hypothetical protein